MFNLLKKSLKEHAVEITNFEKKKMNPLTNKQKGSPKIQKSDAFAKPFEDKYANYKS